MELDKTTAFPPSLGYSRHNLGWTLLRLKKHDEALKHLKEAYRIRRSLQDYKELLVTLEALGEARLARNEYEKARSAALEGLQLESHLGRSPALRGVLSVLAKVATVQKRWDEASSRHGEIIELIEDLRAGNQTIDRLDLFDSRYNRRYLDAIEHFIEVANYPAALSLIDRTRFRSGCDSMEGVRRYGSPLKSDPTWPEPRRRELIIVGWIYPKCDHSFTLSLKDGISYKLIQTSQRQGEPKQVEEWQLHADNMLRQAQKVIDAYSVDLQQCDRLIIVPHGARWHAPLSGLRHPTTSELLLQTHELLLMPSLRYCEITDKDASTGGSRSLVIGDPESNLPGARDEAVFVAEKLGAKLLCGAEATKATVLQCLEDAEYNVIHFACHGVFSSIGLQGLVVSDGVITPEDLARIDFTANLVNLASCWNGMTQVNEWTELSGFLRSVLVKNVNHAITSVYPVPDDSALAFCRAFYSAYVRERPTIKAFREAIITVAEQERLSGWEALQLTGRRTMKGPLD